MATTETQVDLIRRLKRIEGQVRGIQRMIDQDRTCGDILAQLSAVNEAVRRVAVILAEEYAVECLEGNESENKSRQAVANLVDTILKAPR